MNLRVLFGLLLLPLCAAAQSPPVQEIPPGEDEIVPVAKGQQAPFAGQLFSPDTALRWANWLQQYKYRLEWDVTREQKLCVEEKNYRDKLLVIEKERSKKVEDDLVERLRKTEQARIDAESAAEPAWYSTVEFGIVVGTAITAGAFALSIWALEARND